MTAHDEARPVFLVNTGELDDSGRELYHVSRGERFPMADNEKVYTATDYEALRAELDRRTSDVIVHHGQALACSESVMDAYEALRVEVERLRSPLSEAQHHAIREMARSVDTGEASILTAERWQAICALFQEQDSIIRARGDLIEQATARAEAAEARVARLIEIGQRILMNPNVQKQLSYLRDGIGTATENRVWWDLESALNDQGQGNG